MKNLKKFEKSNGVLIFAINTKEINYEKIAKKTAKLVKQFWNLPTTIITNGQVDSKLVNRRFSIDTGTFLPWNNFDRYRAYELSPYEQTILIDSDYLPLCDQVTQHLDLPFDYRLFAKNEYIDSNSVDVDMGKYSLPMLWATVVIFRKTEKAKMLFDLVGRIQRNYLYYKQLYNVSPENYRNDYAFTIADNILNGYSRDTRNYFRHRLVTVGNKIKKLEKKNNQIVIYEEKKAIISPIQDLHILSKEYLTSKQFDTFLKTMK